MSSSKKEYRSPTLQDLGAHVAVVQRFYSTGTYDGQTDITQFPHVNS